MSGESGEAFGLGGQYRAKIAIAFPTDMLALPDDVREFYLTAAVAAGFSPTRYRGAQDMPCTGCETLLSVGPRIQAALAKDAELELLCPICYAANYAGSDFDLEPTSLGNQDGEPMMALVNSKATVGGYSITCRSCGRTARSAKPTLPGKVAICPDCTRRGGPPLTRS